MLSYLLSVCLQDDYQYQRKEDHYNQKETMINPGQANLYLDWLKSKGLKEPILKNKKKHYLKIKKNTNWFHLEQQELE